MAVTCLIRCVLIQVLLITVYGQSIKIAIHCANLTGTVGNPLELHCNVTCNKCVSKSYGWKVNNSDIKCSNEKKLEITTRNAYKFNCIIPSASDEHNGTFKFFVQMNTGQNQTTFNVAVTPATAPTIPGVVSTVTPQSNRFLGEPGKMPENGRSSMVALVVVVMSCLAIGIMVAVSLRRKKDNIMSISALFTHNSSTETEIV